MNLTRLKLHALACSAALLGAAGSAEAHVTLIAPNGGEVFQVGDQVLVEWTVAISHTLLDWDIWYSTTGGAPWVPIATDLAPGSGQVGSPHDWLWTVPNTPSTTVKIRIRMDNSGQDYYDMSDATFTIAGSCCGVAYCDPANANSTGNPATLSASGSDVAGANDLTLLAEDLPPNQFGYFLVSETQGFVQNPAGSQGDLCLAGNIGRFTAQTANSGTNGTISIPVNLASLPVNPTQAVMAGETWSFQCWYRDFNGGSTSNFTHGLAVQFL